MHVQVCPLFPQNKDCFGTARPARMAAWMFDGRQATDKGEAGNNFEGCLQGDVSVCLCTSTMLLQYGPLLARRFLEPFIFVRRLLHVIAVWSVLGSGCFTASPN